MALQLELSFETRSLRELCEHEAVAIGRLGLQRAKALQRQLADLRAATSMQDVFASHKCDRFTKPDELVIGVNPFLNITVRSNHRKSVLRSDGHVDWSNVTRIQIIKIGAPDE